MGLQMVHISRAFHAVWSTAHWWQTRWQTRWRPFLFSILYGVMYQEAEFGSGGIEKSHSCKWAKWIQWHALPHIQQSTQQWNKGHYPNLHGWDFSIPPSPWICYQYSNREGPLEISMKINPNIKTGTSLRLFATICDEICLLPSFNLILDIPITKLTELWL